MNKKILLFIFLFLDFANVYSAKNKPTFDQAHFLCSGRINHLHKAAIIGDVEKVQEIISDGQSLFVSDEQMNLPIHYAAFFGYLEIVELLAEKCSYIDVRGGGGTALLMAVSGGHPAVVEFLLRLGADKNKVDRFGRNAMQIAEFFVGKFSPESPDADAEKYARFVKIAEFLAVCE